ncbi:uncharacterized protein K441DRAFT_654949, partial [Cenococcum geophilum 1.58]|uniref:uncharacterized protein n=1 Tax=Cenococcum geophilum 1.58 TaxID=794803 RepID=UPI00358F21A8
MSRPSKSDSAPVRGEAYEPAGLWTQQSQRRDVAQLRVGGRCGGGRNVVGGSEKFSHGMVRSRKPLLTLTNERARTNEQRANIRPLL